MTDDDKLVVKVVFTGGITSLVASPVDGITPLDAPSGASHARADLGASGATAGGASGTGGAGGIVEVEAAAAIIGEAAAADEVAGCAASAAATSGVSPSTRGCRNC